MDNNWKAVEIAFDILESADIIHSFDDSVMIKIDKELWDDFCRISAGIEGDA